MIVRKGHSVALRSAFTLLEILVVVAIIVVLASVGGMVLLPQLEKSKERAAYMKVKELSHAVSVYAVNNGGNYPASLQDLTVAHQGEKPLVKADLLTDPWNQPFQYDASGQRNGGTEPDIWTRSPKNGKEIGNWPGGDPK